MLRKPCFMAFLCLAVCGLCAVRGYADDDAGKDEAAIIQEEDETGEGDAVPQRAGGTPVPTLDTLQTKFLRERAEAGDHAMQCLYGLSLLNGSAGRIDTTEGGKWLKAAADAGDERGGFEYGKYLYQGLGGPEGSIASLDWLRPAAERGVMEAAYYLGAALLAGEGVEHDPVEGEKWLRKAAVAGISNAQSDLGIAYYSGVGGVKQDYGEARRWFTLAAKQGNGDSCNKLGVMYRNGNGVRADPERAILWFSMGANLGDQFAQYNLGNSYLHGEWVARDFKQAARWHEASALRGNADSQYLMGCFYTEGLGVERNPGRAREWLTHADRGGNAQATELLDRLWEMDDDDEPQVETIEPARVDAAELLRGFSLLPLRMIGRGREVLLRLGEDVDISRGDQPGRYYVTVSGYPGVVCCDGVEDELTNNMVVWGVGEGFSGLDGFLRLGRVRLAADTEVGEQMQVPESVNPDIGMDDEVSDQGIEGVVENAGDAVSEPKSK